MSSLLWTTAVKERIPSGLSNSMARRSSNQHTEFQGQSEGISSETSSEGDREGDPGEEMQ